jgi:hypothetical protein
MEESFCWSTEANFWFDAQFTRITVVTSDFNLLQVVEGCKRQKLLTIWHLDFVVGAFKGVCTAWVSQLTDSQMLAHSKLLRNFSMIDLSVKVV